MGSAKTVFRLVPEVYILLQAVFYLLSTYLANPIAWAFITIIIAQILKGNKRSGLCVGAFFSFVNAWMVLAWYSDLVKVNGPADILFVVVGWLFIVGLILSLIMTYRYAEALFSRSEQGEPDMVS